MFTGIVEATGTVVELRTTSRDHRLRLSTPLASELRLGDSLAVNGVCLTVTRVDNREADFDIGPETARVTNLGSLAPGRKVNLERAMRADSRFGGHFVLGHVDGVGTVNQIRTESDAHWLAIGFPRDLSAFFISKGSVAVDGVSLTVAVLLGEQFEVQIIPHTWQHTTLSGARVGDTVNLECDMIGKYVVRALQAADVTRPPS